jgi:hypothetical protein
LLNTESQPDRKLDTFGVAKDYKTVLGTRQSDIQSSGIVQESNSLMLIAPDTTEDNVILFTTLKSIDAGNFDLLVEILAITAILLHSTDNVRALTFVRSDDSNLTWLNSSSEKLGHNFLAISGFRTTISDAFEYHTD